uniref:Putative DNA recombination protein n=1 Tax=viral metagenome TaxID=1070528 RepID=A0A6M3K223_9ZZZZ
MHYYPEDSSSENLKKIRQKNVCAECGRMVVPYLDKDKKIYLACSGGVHEGITREYKEPLNDYQAKIRREMELENKVGTQGTTALANVPRTGQLTQQQAELIITTVWKDAPPIEVYKAKVLCADYGLHPLMKHIYLIKYNRYGKNREKIGEDWSIQLGIGATRLMAQRKHNFSYLDDTPRRMTKEEGEKILGEDYHPEKGIYAIARLKDMKTGAEVSGWGFFGNDESNPKGMEKGNSRLNMACIRAERHAIDRQYPGDMPTGYDVVDEQFMDTPSGMVNTETGEIKEDADVIEGEATEVQVDEIPQPEPTKEDVAALAEQVKEKLDKKENKDDQASPESVEALKALAEKAGKSMMDLGSLMSKELKWVVPKTLQELKVWQVKELTDILNKAIG